MSLLFSFQQPHFSVRAIFRCYPMPDRTPLQWPRCTVQGCTPSVATCVFPWCEAHSITGLPNCVLFVCFTKGELYSFFIIWPLFTYPLEKRECGLHIVSEAPGPLSTPLRAQWCLSSCTSFQPWSQVVVVVLPEGLPRMRQDVPDFASPLQKSDTTISSILENVFL